MTLSDSAAERESAAHLFFGYIAAILPAYFLQLPDGQKPIRIPHAYALLMGMNDLLRADAVTIENGVICRSSWPRRRVFEATLMREGLWRQTAKPIDAIRDFATLGYLTANGHFTITTSGLQLLVKHAKAVCQFFIGRHFDRLAKTDADWIDFNSRVFLAFFRGDYGEAWGPLRDRVNDAIRELRGGVNLTDALSNNTNYWIIFNIVAMMAEVDSLHFGEIIRTHGLRRLAPDHGSISRAEEELCEAKIIGFRRQEDSRIFYITAPFQSEVEKMRNEVDLGMKRLRDISEQFAGLKKAPS